MVMITKAKCEVIEVELHELNQEQLDTVIELLADLIVTDCLSEVEAQDSEELTVGGKDEKRV